MNLLLCVELSFGVFSEISCPSARQTVLLICFSGASPAQFLFILSFKSLNNGQEFYSVFIFIFCLTEQCVPSSTYNPS